VDTLDLQALSFKNTQPVTGSGQPPYDPAALLKLYLYGYLQGIRSSRKLERETSRNLEYSCAKRMTRVMDNLNTYMGASLYKALEPEEARRILDKLEIHYTPRHGSWLNRADRIEHSVSPMSGSAHSRSGNIKAENRRMARKKKCYCSAYGMAIY
jgi:hypothetical protein